LSAFVPWKFIWQGENMGAPPAATEITINDLIPEVQGWLQNRSDASETQSNPTMRPSSWLKRALQELTANYEFEELKVSGPVVNVGPGLGFKGSNYAYPVAYFLNPGDDVTLTFDPVIFLTPGQAQQAGLAVNTTNVVGYSMDFLDEKAIQSLLFIKGGVPFKYCRHGNQFWFGSAPGSVYQVYLPYQLRHPFDSENLTSSPVYLPSDWHEITSIAAAERGATKLRWNDQASFLHSILHGDPENPEKLGLIAQAMQQPERDRRLSPMTLQVGYDRF
jgi:hypothetical protein